MKILYLTNIHNPYRDEFFESLGQQVDLTVLFEKHSTNERDDSWFRGAKALSYRECYLCDEKCAERLSMLFELLKGFDIVVVGCYNDFYQMAAIYHMRHHGIPYVINSDGIVFNGSNLIKNAVKKSVLRGANAYITAGKCSVSSIRDIVGERNLIHSYPFSSLTASSYLECAKSVANRDASIVLSVGQFEDYKGLDVLLEAAKSFPNKRFRLIGMGRKKEELDSIVDKMELQNVETIAFLKPKALVREYLKAGLFVLPSRQECWGLVINEAAATGCPIVSTYGSGAAVEFLADRYSRFLAIPGDSDSLVDAMNNFMALQPSDAVAYGLYLKKRAQSYTIEATVDAHLALFNEMVYGKRN